MDGPAEPDDATLVARVRQGDQIAFGMLYDRHARPVFGQAYAVTGDADLAQEATQDTFVTAWRKINAIGLVDSSLLPWLLVTARFTALNAKRGQNRLSAHHGEMLSEPPAPLSVEDEVTASHLRAEVDKSVASLSPIERSLYELCIEGDHSYEQAAAQLGVSHAAVRNRLSRLRNRLRAELRSLREDS